MKIFGLYITTVDYEELYLKNTELDKELFNEQKAEISALSRENGELNKDIIVLKANAGALKKRIDELLIENNELVEENNKLVSEISSLKKEIDHVKVKLAERKESLVSANQEISRLGKMIADKEGEEKAKRAAVNAARRERRKNKKSTPSDEK